MLTNDETRCRIAGNVRRLLEARGYNQADLARATGDNEVRVSGVIRGVQTPRADFLARIAEALDVAVDDLLLPLPKKLSV